MNEFYVVYNVRTLVFELRQLINEDEYRVVDTFHVRKNAIAMAKLRNDVSDSMMSRKLKSLAA